MRVGALLGLAVGLVGCANGPQYEQYSSTLRPPSSGYGRIWFYRPSKMAGAAVQPAVRLNGEKVGKAQPGSFFFVDRKPGTYEVKCTTEWSNQTTVYLREQDEKYVRLALGMGLFVGHIRPIEVDRTTGLNEIVECRLITADGANAGLKER